MNKYDILNNKIGFRGPTFSFRNRLARIIWIISWILFARWTPPQAHKIRIGILRLFGANVSWKAYVYSDVSIWAPWNLKIDDYGTLARGVICYNIAPISIGFKTVVSQNVFLCTGTHNHYDPAFPLIAKPINVGRMTWLCANSFVGPGVDIGDGAVLSALSVTHNNLKPWSIYSGNPAKLIKNRPQFNDQ